MITMDPPLVPALRFGRILEARREELGLNIQQVAAELGVHLTADVVADIEAGRRDLSDAELVQISNVYGIDVEKVLPNRAELVIDLDSGLITAGGKVVTFGAGVSAWAGAVRANPRQSAVASVKSRIAMEFPLLRASACVLR